MDTFDPTNLPDTPDIPASIVASGISDAPLTTLVEAAMQRLVASGVPIDRMNVGFRILHPLFDGMSITWTREGGAEVTYDYRLVKALQCGVGLSLHREGKILRRAGP